MNHKSEKYEKDPSFWSTRFRLLQPNLRLPDAKGLDVAGMVREAKEYGANAILVNGGGIVAWYPTSHPFQQMNPQMSGDFLGEAIAAAHDQGLKVLVRMDISKSFPHVLQQHPDWFRRSVEGEVVKHWEMLMTCPTGPYWEAYAFQVIGELLERYPLDGLFFNAFNYLRCYCDRCKQQFKDSTGYELPLSEDWSDPAWRSYVAYRYERFADYNRRLAQFIDETSPGTVLTIDTNITSDSYRGIRDSGWHTHQFAQSNACITSEAFNFFDRPFPKWIYWAGEEVRLGSHIKHTCIILSYSKSIFSRRAAQPEQQLGYDLLQIAANGGSPAVAVSGTFQQNDRQSLPIVKEIMQLLARHEKEYNAMTPLAEVAILYSQRTADGYGREEPAARWQAHYRGMYEMMAESHIPFTVLHEGSLTAEKLKHYRCLLLPNIAILSDEEAKIIDRYVEQGGHIIATMETGRYDVSGGKRQELALRCIGRRIVESDEAFTYLTVNDQQLLGDKAAAADLLMFEGQLMRTEPLDEGDQASGRNRERETELDLFGIPAVRNTTPEFAFWESVSDVPGLIRQTYGKGAADYLPWAIDKLYHLMGVPEYKAVVNSLVRRACGPFTLQSNAPSGVQCTVARREQGGYLLHLINGVATQGKPLAETVVLSNIELAVKGVWKGAHSLVNGQSYPVKHDGGYSRFTLPQLGLYEVLVVQ
ncbi:alpha-amylase family protein [Paenibacillus senegalensis]|uniref:alpha-amylase family protein n=1 Tax=Paenibacillus senegalensis TaxID=1465766 RepID=UPI000287CA5D|nr:alpha-amylase family protein [Paenibacillus senegalensis]